MKIMFYTSSLGKGGAERVISILSNNLSVKYDIDIVVNTLKNCSYKINDNIKLIELDKKRTKLHFIRNIKRIFNTKKIIQKEKPDIIISFLPIPSYRILILKKKFSDIPVIVADRNDPAHEYKSLINKITMTILYARANAFVFQTEQQKQYFNEKIQNNSTIIYNPIKDEFLRSSKTEKENTIITIGRLVKQKNHKILINAFSNISKNYPEYTLKIFGEGPFKRKLQKQINKLNMSKKIKLCGITNSVKEELEKAKIFILSSNYEGMPNALIEAMAVGVPCICTNCPCGGPKELINNGVNGILIDVNNAKQLEEQINFLIINEDVRNKLSRKSIKIREKLSTSKIVQEWEEYIKYVYRNSKQSTNKSKINRL